MLYCTTVVKDIRSAQLTKWGDLGFTVFKVGQIGQELMGHGSCRMGHVHMGLCF